MDPRTRAVLLVDPVRWSFLIADGADAARRAGDDDLEDLFESILELVEKP
jgi:hypothetical protein